MKQARERRGNLLFSYTKKIETIDPMGFFSTNQAVFHGERFFWKSPDDQDEYGQNQDCPFHFGERDPKQISLQ